MDYVEHLVLRHNNKEIAQSFLLVDGSYVIVYKEDGEKVHLSKEEMNEVLLASLKERSNGSGTST